jgi:hypothetical protein
MVREVYEEVTQPRSRRPEVAVRASASKKKIDASSVEVRDVPVLSPAGRRYAAFRSGRATANDAGEAASVALAATEHGFVFVTAEKGAAWLGVREAYPRSTVLHWFLRALVEHGAMLATVAGDIANAERTPAPAWWQAWLDEQASAT